MPASVEGSGVSPAVTAASSTSWSQTCSGGSGNRLIVVPCSASASPTPSATSVTYNSVDMGAAVWTASFDDSTHAVKTQGFILQNPSSGSNTVAVTWATNIGDGGGYSASVINSTGTGTASTATGTAATVSVTPTTTANSLVIDGMCVFQPTVTKDASQTLIRELENINFETALGGSSELASSASTVMTWTYGGGGVANKWATGAIEFTSLPAPDYNFRYRPFRPGPFKPGSRPR